jgi:hypothetical protein
LRKEEYRGIPLLSQRYGERLSSLFVTAIEAQDAVDVSWLIRWRANEQRQSRSHDHHHDDTEAPQQPSSPTAARSRGSYGGNFLKIRAISFRRALNDASIAGSVPLG